MELWKVRSFAWCLGQGIETEVRLRLNMYRDQEIMKVSACGRVLATNIGLCQTSCVQSAINGYFSKWVANVVPGKHVS